ncbi:MAG: recombinase family protein [Nitrospira sp. BO4]|jgi:DNA invertase Pin-like site-specific DNA recombinase|nr:recombinase family protein [Nitrospira sp. BO4]
MKRVRCAIYTRKSSEEGLDQAFNSLDAQREACLAYIESQRHEGWRAVPTAYDDGGFSGGTMDRPALVRLLADVEAGRLDTIVVYKVDRLTRSLADFARIVEHLEAAQVSFVSVTQQFSTTSSMGRLTLNVLLSFAQFEREVTGERIREKIAASKRKGMWMGGPVPLGYALHERQLRVNPEEADRVRLIFQLYLELKCVHRLSVELKHRGICSKVRLHQTGRTSGGNAFFRGALYAILKNRLYRGEIAHRGAIYPGQQAAIVSPELWDAVQALLAANNQAKRTGVYAKDPSLLAGLLFDDRGHRLTPIHTIRRGKRYRYYVSQAVLQKSAQKAGTLCRIPAVEIEQHITQRLETWLATSRDLMEQLALPSDDMATRTALLEGATVWKSLSQREPAMVRAWLLATVQRITVHETSVQMFLSRAGLRTVLRRGPALPTPVLSPRRNQEEQDDLITISSSVTLTRCGGGMRLIVPGESGGERRGTSNVGLIKAVARAHVWSERLLSGEVTSLRAIAREHGVTPGYVGRLLRCAFLAPEIVDAILHGHQPLPLTIARLCKNLPLDWTRQVEGMGLRGVSAARRNPIVRHLSDRT